MKKVILASTSTLFGETYLSYILPIVKSHFEGISSLLFIPFARPDGISHDDYTEKVASVFATIGIKVKGLHTFEDKKQAVQQAEAIFTGGGNTFLLVKTLHELDLMHILKSVVEQGTPYLGTSAGSNIGGMNMKTTNDMPIVYPPSFDTMGLVPFNINPHYLDPNPDLKHNGETRETRIKEFLTQNNIPVIGVREGNWILIKNNVISVEGSQKTRIFEQGKAPYEVDPGTILNF